MTLTLTIPVTLCSIGIIRDGHGVPTELRIHPVTPGYPVVFYPSGQAPVSPELPQQIRWTVHRLEPGEEVVIVKKASSPHVFNWDTKPQAIDALDPEFNSGPPIVPPGPGKQTRAWVYSLELRSPRLRDPIVLDPVIIIEPDPK